MPTIPDVPIADTPTRCLARYQVVSARSWRRGHDCDGEITPPDEVIDDVLLVSRGPVEGLASAARLAATDPRDLRLAADMMRLAD